MKEKNEGNVEMMEILLKETVMKLLENNAPKLYRERFENELVLTFANDYIEGRQSKILLNYIRRDKNMNQYDE